MLRFKFGLGPTFLHDNKVTILPVTSRKYLAAMHSVVRVRAHPLHVYTTTWLVEQDSSLASYAYHGLVKKDSSPISHSKEDNSLAPYAHFGLVEQYSSLASYAHHAQPGREHHHDMIARLMRHLAANCPCRGLVWIGIGAHELKHGRPWYEHVHDLCLNA